MIQGAIYLQPADLIRMMLERVSLKIIPIETDGLCRGRSFNYLFKAIKIIPTSHIQETPTFQRFAHPVACKGLVYPADGGRSALGEFTMTMAEPKEWLHRFSEEETDEGLDGLKERTEIRVYCKITEVGDEPDEPSDGEGEG